ncbi:hypothetical protein BT69DRAFT_1325515 [Atractiella rhizophila]|nr:hypothetical protein BT69DRAFT_1325515 [Atractiella rhizophila]
MSSSDTSVGPSPTVEEQLHLAVQRAALEEVLSASRTYLTALFALYCWDFILNFPDEYKMMWKAERWTPVRVAFFINRYGGLLDLVAFMCFYWLKIDLKTCGKVHLLQPVVSSFVLLSCQFLLGARVFAMWNRRRWIAWFFGIFAICGVVVQIVAVVPNRALRLLPGLRGCFSVRGDQSYLWVYNIPPLLYDTAATIFIIVPLISHWRKTPRTRLLTIFARDGVLYFVVASVCNLVNVIYFSIPTTINPALNAPLSLTFTSIMATRIVLHLRSAGLVANGQDRGTSNGSSSGRRYNMTPKIWGNNQSAERGEPEVHLQSLGRRVDGTLPVSYGGVVVKVETMTTLDKGVEPLPDAEVDEYSWSKYDVQDVAKTNNQPE